MRKYVFSIVLALCLVAALLPGIPAAADGHNHTCLCGAENCTQTGTGHEKIPDDAVWEGIGEDKFKTFEIGEAGHTHYYYLTENIDCDAGNFGIYFYGNVVLCLNGHDIDFSGGQNRLAIKPIADHNTKLTICDCNRTQHNCIVEYNDTYNNKKYDYTYYGGAIKGYRLDISSGTLNLYRCTITGSNNAAAINMASGTTLNMYDGANVLGNSVRDDSAVLVRGEFNMYGGLIAGNYANSANSYGGGVRVGGSNTEATFHMYDGTIQDNMADNGGGVSVTGGSTFNMHGGTIENNATRGGGWQNYGGGVLVHSGTFNMYGGTITGNQTGTGNGGGLALREGTQSTANIYGGTISDNTSHGYGGGIYVSGNTLNIEPDEGKVISITGNKAFDCPTEGHQTGRGGGMYLGNLANGTLTLDQVNISNNTAEDCGGGLFVSCDVNLEDGASITGNGANSGEYLAGGGVYLAGGTFDLNGGEISNNKDDILNGAGVYVAGGMFNLNSGKINGNKAQAYGGGVYVAGGTFNLNGGEISSNEASFAGGMNYEGGKVTINEGSTISGNTATRGAGIMVSGDNITMSGGIITDNRAKGNQYKNGGGVYIVQYTKQGTGVITGVFTMTGGKITGNTADIYGGGVYIQNNGIFNVSGDANVSGNTVNGRANNVYLSDTNAVLTITGTLSGAKFGITANANKPFTSGWNTNMSGSDPTQFFTSDLDDCYVTLSGDEVELRNGYQINYELNGGQFVDEYTPVYSYVSGDQAITLPGADAVTRNGYTFDGWYENEDLSGQACTVIASGSTGPKTFYAKWTAKTYRVTLETNGGTIVGSGLTEYTCGQGAELPTNVEKSGYTFAGWYENDRFEGSAVTAISDTEYGDKTYYAKWMSKTYSVTLNTNGGTIKSGNVTNYSYGEGAVLPTDVEKSGYTFAGWYGNEQLTGSTVTAISDTEYGDKTYYAKWTSKTYSITFNTDGGTIKGSYVTNYTYGEGAVLPTDVEKSGYTFAGWYDNEELTGSAATAISNTEYGDKTYYAKWTANTYSVKLHLNGGNLADGVSDITAYTYGQYILGKPANGIGDRAIYQPTP
ncbi:MAG: InlB B-repeat-containing protein [Oscillospiraceae bacterium]